MAKKKAESKEDNQSGSIKTEVVYNLKDLPGVGDTTVKKLREAGIVSIRILAVYPITKLMEDAGIGEKTAQKIIKAAQDIENMGFKSADIIWEKRKHLNRLTTNSANLGALNQVLLRSFMENIERVRLKLRINSASMFNYLMRKEVWKVMRFTSIQKQLLDLRE